MNQAVFFGQIAVCSQDAEGDRKVETCALLSYIGGCQVDSDSLKRKKETTVTDSGANTFARLSHSSVRQSHNGDGQWRICLTPDRREINFYVDEISVNAINSSGQGTKEHG